MNRRLQQFLAAENISQSQFADTIGVARASISHILAGRNKPGFDFIERTAKHFPELNLDWLITGRGKMYGSVKTASEAPAEPISPLPASDVPGLFDELDTPNNALTNPLDRIDQTLNNQRSISKVIVFFTDGSFQEIP